MSEEKTMIYYQPTVQTYKYSWLRGKWMPYNLYPSTLIFPSWGLAEQYKYKFIEGLRNRKVKLKEGTFKIYHAKLVIPES